MTAAWWARGAARVGFAAAAVVLAGCAGGPTLVDMDGVDFFPESLTVKAGTTVTWKNDDTWSHTVTSDEPGGPLQSGEVGPGGRFVFTFQTPGTYRYHCVPHSSSYEDGSFAGMVGTVVVGA